MFQEMKSQLAKGKPNSFQILISQVLIWKSLRYTRVTVICVDERMALKNRGRLNPRQGIITLVQSKLITSIFKFLRITRYNFFLGVYFHSLSTSCLNHPTCSQLSYLEGIGTYSERGGGCLRTNDDNDKQGGY